LTEGHLKRLNSSMDNCSDVLNRLEAVNRRPSADIKGGAHVSSEMLEHKSAFNNYVRRGQDADLATFEQKALSTSRDNEGGFLVTSDMATQINSSLKKSCAMRQIANVTEVSTDGLEILEDKSNTIAGWTADEAQRGDTKTPTIHRRFISTHELYAQPRATQKLVDDSRVDIEAWLAEKIADNFSSLENNAFIHGDGTTMPKGFLNDVGLERNGIDVLKSKLDSDTLHVLYAELDCKYMENAKLLMNHQTLAEIRMMKNKAGQYIWQPVSDDQQVNKVLGVDVVLTPDMPELKGGNCAIALGDFKQGYQIVDRSGVTTLRDPFTQKPYIKFYTTKRVGGDILDANAIKILRCA